jgi:hypothetical protein
MGKTLFEIGADMEALDAVLEEVGGDITDDAAAQAIDEWLMENRDNLSQKLDGYAALIQQRNAMAAARMEEAKRLQALAVADTNAARWLAERLKLFFETYGLQKVETARYKVALQRNGGVLPLLLDDDLTPSDVPEDFVIEVPATQRIDTGAIRAALERGEALEFARLGERGTQIRIR